MLKKFLPILLLAALTGGAPAQTNYIYNGPNSAAMDWTNAANYLVNGAAPLTFPNFPGDKLIVNNGSKKAYDYRLHGNKVIAEFRKTCPNDANTAFVFGSVTNCSLIWDTGMPGVRAVFQDYGGAGDANAGELRCASYVHYVLNSDLLWQGSTKRGYANRWNNNTFGTQGNCQLWGDISGAGKLYLQWNASKAQLSGSIPMNLAVEGGLTRTNTHRGGTEFDYFAKGTGLSPTMAYRAGFNLNKYWATGTGDTIVHTNAEIYITNITSIAVGQDVIHDYTSIYLESNQDPNMPTNAVVELNNTLPERIGGLYFDGAAQAVGTWGSSSSGATHTSDVWFRGSGVLEVVAPPTHTIGASAGANGTISPSGAVSVVEGRWPTFTITPALGYVVSSLVVDSTDLGPAITSYTFTNVVANHTISASFTAMPPQTITASAGANGAIDPSGAVTVTAGTSQTFNMLPDSGYKVANVVVDGVSIGATNKYTFAGVIASHSIAVSFIPIPPVTLTATAGPNGTISPIGSVVILEGSSQTFAMVPDNGYAVADVLVDGVSQGEIYSYRFAGVTVPHTIGVSFRPLAMAVPQAQDLVFGVNAATLPGDTNQVNSWASMVPASATLARLGGAPVSVIGTENIGGPAGTNVWESNLKSSNDGFVLQGAPGASPTGQYLTSINCVGASIVAVAAPVVDPYNGDNTVGYLADVFLGQLSLGVRHDTGALFASIKGTGISLDGANANQILANGLPAVISLVVNADGYYRIRINGLPVASGTVAAFTGFDPGLGNNASASYVTLGRTYTGTAAFTGNIGDVFVYKAALGNAEREQLERLLLAKYHVASPAAWSGPIDGAWSLPGNWVTASGTAPGYGQNAVLSASSGAGGRVQLDTTCLISGLLFNNVVPNMEIASATGQLFYLDNGAAWPFIETRGGNLTISAPMNPYNGLQKIGAGTLTLAGSADIGATLNPSLIVADAGSELLISGRATSAGLRVSRGGTLTISGSLNSGAGQNIVLGEGATAGQAFLTGSWTNSGDGNFDVGYGYPAGTGTLTVGQDAVLDLSGMTRPLSVALGNNGGSTGTIVQNGGTVLTKAVGSAWIGGSGPGLALGNWYNTPCTAEYDLNGGTLVTPNVYNVHNSAGLLTAPNGSAVFRFNGGVLKATQSDNQLDPAVIAEGSTNLMGNLSHAYVGAGGARVDTAGFACGINQALEHDPLLGTTADGGLSKLGDGTLALYQAATYTGATRVQAGTLRCASPDALAPNAVEIASGAFLELAFEGTRVVPSLKINGVSRAHGVYGAGNEPALTGTGTLTVGAVTPPTPELPAGSFSFTGGMPTFSNVPTLSGYTYWLVYKNSLTDPGWTRIGTGTPGGGNHTFTDTATPYPGQRFYRLEVQ